MSATEVICAGNLTDPRPPAGPSAAELPAQVSARLMRTSSTEIDTAVREVLGILGMFAGADAAALYLAEPGAPAGNDDIPSHCWHRVDSGEALHVTHAGGGTSTLVPVSVEDRVVGVLRLDADGGMPPWPAEVLPALRAAATVLGTALDRRAALAEAEEGQRRYKSVLDDVGAVIVRVTAEGRISYVNRAWTELTGIPVDEMIGKDALHHVHPDDRQVAAQHMADALSDDGTVREVRFLTQDGGERWMEVKGRALHDAAGNISGFAGTMHDVTERRHSEQLTKAARDRAERARDQAERASNAKSEFLSRMSHELRTPLNAILGFGQLLELGALDGEEADNLSQIMRAGRHLLHLINDSLDVARIETGRLSLSVEPVQLGPLVTESLDLMRPTADARGITLVPPVADGARRCVRADRQRLKQVLVNLASNAVKYNRDGGRVTVECYPVAGPEPSGGRGQEAAEPGWLRIAINDTGIGIPADRVEDIFLPFERIGAELTDVEGTGLGLALTKSLVDAMGGRITVSSVQGIGATFYVDLPAASVADTRVEQGPLTDADADTPPPAHTVLYIEDNPSNVILVRRILARRPQVRLLIANDGATGLKLVREHRPQMVLLDLHLPQMGGAEVLDVIRTDADPALRMTPIVVVTADLSPGTEERIRDAGANAFIGKPIDLHLLLDTVDRHVGAPT